jgi:hypothetical protein
LRVGEGRQAERRKYILGQPFAQGIAKGQCFGPAGGRQQRRQQLSHGSTVLVHGPRRVRGMTPVAVAVGCAALPDFNLPDFNLLGFNLPGFNLPGFNVLAITVPVGAAVHGSALGVGRHGFTSTLIVWKPVAPSGAGGLLSSACGSPPRSVARTWTSY